MNIKHDSNDLLTPFERMTRCFEIIASRKSQSKFPFPNPIFFLFNLYQIWFYSISVTNNKKFLFLLSRQSSMVFFVVRNERILLDIITIIVECQLHEENWKIYFKLLRTFLCHICYICIIFKKLNLRFCVNLILWLAYFSINH